MGGAKEERKGASGRVIREEARAVRRGGHCLRVIREKMSRFPVSESLLRNFGALSYLLKRARMLIEYAFQ